MHVLKVEQSISALARTTLLNIVQELIVLCIAIANHLHVNLFFVTNVKDDVTMFFVLFDFFVCRFADV
jgi:hypothetical protein